MSCPETRVANEWARYEVCRTAELVAECAFRYGMVLAE